LGCKTHVNLISDMNPSNCVSDELRKLRTLFKYCSNSPQVIEGIFRDHKIRFTQPYGLNDPFEFNPDIRFNSNPDDYQYYEYDGVVFPSNYLVNWLNLIESRINMYGVLSLTKNPFSYEMWSHYANGHKGVLIEFNVGNIKNPQLQLEHGCVLPVHKVRYVRTNVVDLEKMVDRNQRIPENQFHNIFLHKTKLWKYEREYRVIRRLDSCENYRTHRTSYRDDNVYLFPISLDCIISVTFGVNTSVENKEKIIRVCDGHNIAFLQALIPKGSQNEVKPIAVTEFGSLENYLDMGPQLFTFDPNETRFYQLPTIKVNALLDIPYYSSQKEDYDAYYEKRKARSCEKTQLQSISPPESGRD